MTIIIICNSTQKNYLFAKASKLEDLYTPGYASSNVIKNNYVKVEKNFNDITISFNNLTARGYEREAKRLLTRKLYNEFLEMSPYDPTNTLFLEY